MIKATVIIVGGGPAGTACARELGKSGIDALILDKKTFPRGKLCAGWITPKVLADLELSPGDYPHSLMVYRRILFYFRGIPIPVKTRQYAIRRWEFDAFLVKRTKATVLEHAVEHIRKSNGHFIIDDAYACKYIVGAGGTHCPVYRQIFSDIRPRHPRRMIAAVEEEFPFDWTDPECRLWFFDNGLPGYAWYAPKQNGYLNLGIGGKQAALKRRGETIHTRWRGFIEDLIRKKPEINHHFRPRAHVYYLRGDTGRVQENNAFIIGDAAALATRDMGEGIGPAIESGKLAARSIITGRPYSIQSVTRWSAPGILLPGYHSRTGHSGRRHFSRGGQG
jgi:menaquinone-9 beta-reductase